jgi:hypothetical protein
LVSCPFCTSEALPGDRYCRKCGKLIQKPEPSVLAPPAQNFEHVPSDISLKKTIPVSQLHANEAGEVTKRTIAMVSATRPMSEAKSELQETTAKSTPGAQRADTAEKSSLTALIRRIHEQETEIDQLKTQSWKTRAMPSRLSSGALLILGAVSLLGAIVYTSTVLAFIGLGLAFYGMLFLFIRPARYVESETLVSALSPIKTLDLLLTKLGYHGRGIYLPAGNGVVLFVPESDESQLAMNLGASENLQTLANSSQGVMLSPPGLALTRIIERGLGAGLSTRGLGYLEDRLPRMLVEGPQIVKDMQMQVEGSRVRFQFGGSVYCDHLRNDGGKCSTGCPLCSALACILVRATGRPVVFEEESRSGRDTFESTYRIVEES